MTEGKTLVGPPAEAVIAALDRVVKSDGFAASPQLSRFLRHVVENALYGTQGQMKESLIGLFVFHRSAGYDPKVDPIVRVEARRLRARLDEYYLNAGAAEEVRIRLPKGGYAPEFEIVPVQVEESAEIPIPDNTAGSGVPVVVDAPVAIAEKRRPQWFVWIAAVLAFAAAGSLFVGIKHTKEDTSVVHKFWTSLLNGNRPAMLVPADSGLVMLQDLVHQPVPLSEYLSGDYRARLGAVSDLARSLGARRYTSIADLEFATRLSRRAEAAKGISIRYARDMRVGDLKENNLILVGARHSNPWVELFEKDATLRLDHDERTSVFTVRNMRPGPGEPAVIEIRPDELKDKIYGIVTFHRYGAGNSMALVLAGTSVAGTEAASDFLLNDAALTPWLRKASSDGGEIRGFDLLLATRNLSGSAPTAEVVAFHAEK